MKYDPPNKTKREEVMTYRQLGLNRRMKSRAQRTRLEQSGVHVVIGGSDPDRPYLQVGKTRYREIKRAVALEFLEKARLAKLQIPVAALLQHFQTRIEQTTYDRLAAELEQAVRLESAFLQHHGRSPTAQEKARFNECSQPGLAPGFKNRQQSLIDGLLNKVQERQTHNPARYQSAWAQVVGPELAQQSCLERVDSTGGVAYFRCLNSTLSYQLQRRTDLAKKLGHALGVTVRFLKVSR